jgi:hypothetical protein
MERAAQAPLDRQQVTVVVDPALMPSVARDIVDGKAFAFVTVYALI